MQKKHRRLALILIILFVLVSCSLSPDEGKSTVRSGFTDILHSCQTSLNGFLQKMVDNPESSVLLTLIGISLLYGLVHSLGPGHGKMLIASFFLKEKHPLRKSLLLAGIVSLVHSGSAIILSLLLSFVLTGLRGIFRIKLQAYFITASGIMILCIGVIFLLTKLLHRHSHSGEEPEKNVNIVLVGISAGIVPCPVALMIMLLTIPRGIVHIGLLSVLFMSVGMFLLLTAVGVTVILSRKGIITIADKTMIRAEKVSSVMEFASIGFILLIGIFMII